MKATLQMWFALGVVSMLLSAPLWAGTTTQHAIPDSESMLICKKVRVTGSRIRQTVCKTKAQAVSEHTAGQNSVENMRHEVDRLMQQGQQQQQRPAYDQRRNTGR